jgi:histidinol-phosphate phosphatase family protein
LAKLRAIFLDRDGVLTREKSDYAKSPEELEILPIQPESLKRIREKGFALIVITNQSVIGRGLTTHQQMAKIHEKLLSELAERGCKIDAVYYCPHRPEEKCSCRKPEPGLILKAAEEFDVDISRSWMIGDKDIDLEAASRAGCRGVKVQTNKADLDHAVTLILQVEGELRK